MNHHVGYGEERTGNRHCKAIRRRASEIHGNFLIEAFCQRRRRRNRHLIGTDSGDVQQFLPGNLRVPISR